MISNILFFVYSLIFKEGGNNLNFLKVDKKCNTNFLLNQKQIYKFFPRKKSDMYIITFVVGSYIYKSFCAAMCMKGKIEENKNCTLL